MDETAGGIKKYILDTNVFRHTANHDQAYKKASKRFWKIILTKIENDEALLCTPKEVIRELEVQFYALPSKEKELISRLLEYAEEMDVDDECTPEIEHTIRKMEALIKYKYRNDICEAAGISKIEYGNVSDARVLFSAWQADSILVTANIRDFILYLFFFDADEDRLYDLLTGNFVKVPKLLSDKIKRDNEFIKLYTELNERINEYNLD